jgi:hypothetical protein
MLCFRMMSRWPQGNQHLSALLARRCSQHTGSGPFAIAGLAGAAALLAIPVNAPTRALLPCARHISVLAPGGQPVSGMKVTPGWRWYLGNETVVGKTFSLLATSVSTSARVRPTPR